MPFYLTFLFLVTDTGLKNDKSQFMIPTHFDVFILILLSKKVKEN